MGISCPLKQSPSGDSRSPKGRDGISGACGTGAAGEMRGMGIPPPAPRSPSTLQQGRAGGTALPIRAGMASSCTLALPQINPPS